VTCGLRTMALGLMAQQAAHGAAKPSPSHRGVVAFSHAFLPRSAAEDYGAERAGNSLRLFLTLFPRGKACTHTPGCVSRRHRDACTSRQVLIRAPAWPLPPVALDNDAGVATTRRPARCLCSGKVAECEIASPFGAWGTDPRHPLLRTLTQFAEGHPGSAFVTTPLAFESRSHAAALLNFLGEEGRGSHGQARVLSVETTRQPS